MAMICVNMMCMKWGRLVYVRFSRLNGDGRSSVFTCKRTLHKPSRSISALATEGRIKREDYSHIKYDYAFSEWKILIGSYDWKDHSMRKEGAERYRTQNLPNCTCLPVVYELGTAMLPRKLVSKCVIPVYVGKTDNVRTRLQQYGRNGSHLENYNEEFTNSSVSSLQGLGLFSGIFSRGFSIVYRWAPMKSKKEVEETEDELLRIYDYAWNKSKNGDRRPHDIHKILDRKSQCFLLEMMLKYVH